MMPLADGLYGNNAAVTAIKEACEHKSTKGLRLWRPVEYPPPNKMAYKFAGPTLQGGGMLLRFLFDDLAQLPATGNALAPTNANNRQTIANTR
jgi:hypothetical protein